MSKISSIAELKAIIVQRSKKPDNDRAPYIMKSQLMLIRIRKSDSIA